MLLLIGLMSSCTWKHHSETVVVCPCTIVEITKYRNENNVKDYEVIKVTNTHNNWYTFETLSLNYYQIGDTIR